MRRSARGRLTDIETLPPRFNAVVARAWHRVVDRQGTQLAILEELNAALVAGGARTMSQSGFNRWATRVVQGQIPCPVAYETDPAALAEAIEQFAARAPKAAFAAAIALLSAGTKGDRP